jgi:hypothetical protein
VKIKFFKRGIKVSLINSTFPDLILNETVKSSIQLLLSQYVTPKLKLINQNRKKNNEIIESSFNDKFEEYLSRSYSKYSIINSIVLKNNQNKITDLYIPLTLIDDERSNEGNNPLSHKVTGYNNNFFEKYKKLLITDTAGMGKSTLLKWIFLDVINKGEKIPILIELRKLSETNNILNEIMKELNPINSEFDKEFVLDLINRGDFIFLLDGFDEIPFMYKSKVTTYLQEFIWKANKNIYVISSRREPETSGFTDFKEFHIKPLEISEAHILLRKYGKNTAEVENLIQSINNPRTLIQIKDFLKNPLMVSLLFKGYEYKPSIPNKKHIFYYNVYSALFDEHDFTKGGAYTHEKRSKLDIDQFHSVLRKLGYLSLQKNTVEFDKSTLLDYIGKAKANCYGATFTNVEFLNDIYITVPIFVCEGDTYKWSHKSFMEYFAAQYIFKDTGSFKNSILNAIKNSKKISTYSNLMDIYFDLDQKGFEEIFVVDLVKSFIEFFERNHKIPIEIREKLFLRDYLFSLKTSNHTKLLEAYEVDLNEDDTNYYAYVSNIKATSLTLIDILYSHLIEILNDKNHIIVKEKNKSIKKIDSLLRKIYKNLNLSVSDYLFITTKFNFGKNSQILNLIEPLLDSTYLPTFSYKKCKSFIEGYEKRTQEENNDLLEGF